MIGDSLTSEALELMAASLPGKPEKPFLVSSTENQIKIGFSGPSDNGGSPITDFQVWWDAGSGGSFSLAGSSLNLLEFTTSANLVTGATYRFKVRATNHIGVGLDSDVTALLSAAAPEAPEKPYKFQATESQITITWPGLYNGGAPITQYEVLMALVGSSETPQGIPQQNMHGYVDISTQGVFNIAGRKFTISSSIQTGYQY